MGDRDQGLILDSLHPQRTALLVIDMQKGWLLDGSPGGIAAGLEMLPRLNQLIDSCRQAGCTVVHTRQFHDYTNPIYKQLLPQHYDPRGRPYFRRGSSWVEFHDDLSVREGDVIIDKDRYSAFYGTNLEIILRNRGIDTLIVTGVASNVCCESTARDAFFRDFLVLFVSDCTATVDERLHRATLDNISAFFGRVMSWQEVLDMLTVALQ